MESYSASDTLSPPPSAVPAFIVKLWTLLEEPSNDQLIGWSRNGQTFRILDEQRFAKEILPKYFKHNNLSSFIRQLNMYGFRKLISLESGLLKTDKNSVIEFQHPFFKQGQAELLEHIKRKVSIVKSEDGKLSHADLHKVLVEIQEMRDEQNSMDAKLDLMRRENKALWKEVSMLRRKHTQQQTLLSKILHFILSLMRRNYVVGVNRKRPLLDATGAVSPKYSCNYIQIPVENSATLELGEHRGSNAGVDGVVIQDITTPTHGPIQKPHTPPNATEAFNSNEQVLSSPERAKSPSVMSQSSGFERASPVFLLQMNGNTLDNGGVEGDILELHSVMASEVEDPSTVINAILNESNSPSNNDIILDREEMQDFLNCIDLSLEELQVLLSKSKYSPDFELVNDASTENIGNPQPSKSEAAENKDKQLMQYVGNTVLSLFADLPSDGSKVDKDPEDLLRVLQADVNNSIPLNCNGTSAPPSPSEQVNLLETYGLPLLVEDINGEYKDTPLFVLSPVNNLIEEATEAEVD